MEKPSPDSSPCLLTGVVLSSKWYRWPKDSPIGYICKKAYLKEYHKANKTVSNERRRNEYATDDAEREKILTRNTLYREANNDLLNQRKREKYALNPIEELFKRSKWKREHHEDYLAGRTKRRALNRDDINKYRREHHDRYRAAYAAWRSNNAELKRSYMAARRALEFNATPPALRPFIADEIKRIYEECPEGYVVDHIIPFKHKFICGLHVPSNLQYLSYTDNMRKLNLWDGTLENNSWRVRQTLAEWATLACPNAEILSDWSIKTHNFIFTIFPLEHEVAMVLQENEFGFWADEWLNMSEIVQSMILAKLGQFRTRLYARDCQIIEMNKNQARSFLSIAHLQGSCPSEHCFALYYGDTPVQAIAWGKHHRLGDKETVISRVATRPGYQVVGGFSKLLTVVPKPVTTWSDNRYSKGGVYSQTMVPVQKVPPAYQYTKDQFRFSKQSLRKTMNERASLLQTEFQLRIAQGYGIMWDAGKIKWQLD